MDEFAFSCQFCDEQQKWSSQESADSAALWHLFDEHPLRCYPSPAIRTRPAHRRHRWVTAWSGPEAHATPLVPPVGMCPGDIGGVDHELFPAAQPSRTSPRAVTAEVWAW